MADLRTDTTIIQAWDEHRPGDLAPLMVLDEVRAVLDRHGIGEGPVEADVIGGGHSNVTFLLRRGDARVVLRRPPRPPFPASAHDVLREARILSALEGTDVPVPRVLVQCDDPAVLGVPFYVMDYLDGVVINDRFPRALATPEHRADLGASLMDALVAIHGVDVQRQGLDGLAKPTGYLERQIRRFTQIWDEVHTREIPLAGELSRWLEAHRPASQETTLIHGDFRVGNMLYAELPPSRVLAVLDWEMATLGDPLADLGYLVATYADHLRPDNLMSELATVTRDDGFPTREELAATYAARTGRSVEHLRWYEVLALWKSMVFLESSYRRFRAGAVDDPWFAEFGVGVPLLAEAAWELTRA